jgi:hypothetical protein
VPFELPRHVRVTQLSDDEAIPSFFIRFRDPIQLITDNWNCVRADDPDADRIVLAADVLIVQRSWTVRSKRLVTRFKATGRPVIYETDDFMLELPLQSALKISEEKKATIRSMVSAADLVTCSTAALAQSLSLINPHVHVLENYAIPFDLPAVRGARGKLPHLCIVNTDYFKLTVAKAELFDALRYGIETLDYRCSCFGSVDPLMTALAAQFPLQVRLNAGFVPWRKTFLTRLMTHAVNVAIVPLENAEYHRFKSDVKFFDFGSIGVAGIYNNTAVYHRVLHRQNGFVCDGTYRGWVDGLEHFADEANRNQCGDTAYHDAAARSIDTYAAELAALIRNLSS